LLTFKVNFRTFSNSQLDPDLIRWDPKLFAYFWIWISTDPNPDLSEDCMKSNFEGPQQAILQHLLVRTSAIDYGFSMWLCCCRATFL
jgi:hypothetical protein